MSDPAPTKKKRRPRAKKGAAGAGTRSSSSPPSSERPRKARAWKPRSIAGLVAGGVAAALLFGGLALFLIYPSAHGPGSGRDVELDLPGDESLDALAARLTAAGLVQNERFLASYLRVTGAASRVVRGPHILTDDLSPREIVARLERSPWAAHVHVTFPEGWTRFDFARRLQERRVCTARAFLDATVDPEVLASLHIDGAPSAEGFLFPATYELGCDSDPKDVVRKMKLEFDKRWATASEKHESSLLDVEQSLHWGMRDVVTLASIIEKEAVMDDERATIASVFVNRLRDPAFTPKLLQTDPSAGYGCLVAGATIPACAAFTGKITHDLLQDASNPYNTYKHEGLPPGPIANPGAKSLAAAMAPATTRFFYFVARGEGRHTFSATYGEHTSAVRGTQAPSTQATPATQNREP